MDKAILEAQLAGLEVQLALTVPGSVQQATIQAQITTLENELAEVPVVPPIFGRPGRGVHGHR